MATELPVRIEFSLPDGWKAAPPDEVGATGVAFVALHPKATDGVAANLTIAGEFRDATVSMTTVADESVRRLESVAESVRVRERSDLPSGITQLLVLEMGQGKRLVQCQVYVPMDDAHDPRRRAVLELVLTCTPDQLDNVLPDFQQFVGTVRPGS